MFSAVRLLCAACEMAELEDQQFCLRWNNFQANITSQFEALRDDEDFTDVTIACDGQRLQAHKVVLSACSPFFKEIFKVCKKPIIYWDYDGSHDARYLYMFKIAQIITQLFSNFVQYPSAL